MLQVKDKIYNGVHGFAVCGRGPSGKQASVFVRRLSTARAIQKVLNDQRCSREEKQRLTDRLILEEER